MAKAKDPVILSGGGIFFKGRHTAYRTVQNGLVHLFEVSELRPFPDSRNDSQSLTQTMCNQCAKFIRQAGEGRVTVFACGRLAADAKDQEGKIKRRRHYVGLNRSSTLAE